jgi:hypothetical protein
LSNSWYAKGLGHFASADVNFPADNIKAALVTSAYVPDTSAAGDEFLSTISGIGGAILARSANLTGKSATGGVLNCTNFTFPLVASGHVVKYVVFYKDTGVDATSILLLIDDTGNNLPTTTDGGDLQYQVSTGPNKLGAL